MSNESLQTAREVCTKIDDIKTYIGRGKIIAQGNSAANIKMEETLFFYPIKGMLTSLSTAIYNNLLNKRNDATTNV